MVRTLHNFRYIAARFSAPLNFLLYELSLEFVCILIAMLVIRIFVNVLELLEKLLLLRHLIRSPNYLALLRRVFRVLL